MNMRPIADIQGMKRRSMETPNFVRCPPTRPSTAGSLLPEVYSHLLFEGESSASARAALELFVPFAAC